MTTDPIRRELLKVASSTIPLSFLPLALIARPSSASTNPELRRQLKYQGTPLGDKSCMSCLEFIPGKTDQALGACKRIPGDDEISPNGYCTLWNTL